MKEPNKFGDKNQEAIGISNAYVSESVPVPSVAHGHGDRYDSLVYLSCPNSDNEVNLKNKNSNKKKKKKKEYRKGEIGWKGDDWTPDNKNYKIMKSLRWNMKYWAKIYGVETMFFHTLTFAENITCPKEANRRFNNYNRQFSRIPEVHWLYKGIEPQERGALHFHIVGHTDWDLGANVFDWDSYDKCNEAYSNGNKSLGLKYKRQYSATANDKLKYMWKKTQTIGQGSGFGRFVEFLPIKKVESISQYIGKYLGKTFAAKNNGKMPQGIRRFSYSKHAPQPHGREFSWVENTSKTHSQLTWRQKLKAWAHGVGIREDDYDDLEAKYGKAWARNYREDIEYFGMTWFPFMNENKFGHAKPFQYPTGLIGNPLAHMKLSDDPIWQNDSQMWKDWLTGNQTSSGQTLGEHQRSLIRHQKAKKAKAFHERVYG
jgi:hypothetical protein